MAKGKFEASSVLVLGGGSEIATGILMHLLRTSIDRLVLADLSLPVLTEQRAKLVAIGIPEVEIVEFDARDIDSHGPLMDRIFASGPVDLAIVAFGVLDDEAILESEPLRAANLATINYVGAVSVCLHLASRMQGQCRGAIVVLSSAAAARSNRRNYVYASSKAALDSFALGLGGSLADKGLSVLVVRPGFVRSRMTTGRPVGKFVTDADSIGRSVARALARGDDVVHVPRRLGSVTMAVRLLPRWLHRKLPT